MEGEREQPQQKKYHQRSQKTGRCKASNHLQEKTKNGFGHTKQGGHWGISRVQVEGIAQNLIIWTLNSY
jgi:hypothetical protein